MRSATLLTVLILASVSDAIAQDLPLAPGQRVRVTVPSRYVSRQQDTFRQVRGDTLVLESGLCLFADVTRIEAHQGQKSAWASGLLWGSVSGALLGAFFGAASGDDPPGWLSFSAEEKAVFGGLFLGGVGAVSGLVIGALTKKDKWEEVPLDGRRVSIVPARRGLGLGASFTF